MAREIDILVVEPGKTPCPAKVMDTLEAFQEIVGGPIEIGSYLPQRVMLIRNIKAYTLAALYNAPTTIGQFYASLVNHDLAQGAAGI